MIGVLASSPAGEAAKAGPWWGAVVLLLCLACWLLFRSMSKHLRKVREGFPRTDGAQPPPEPTHGPEDAARPAPDQDREPPAP